MQHQHQGSSSQAVEEQAQTQNAPLLQPLRTHPTPNWDPATVKVTLNLALDGCIVPSTAPPGARVDYSHLVVLDNFLDEPTRQGLLDALTAPGWSDQHQQHGQLHQGSAGNSQGQGHIIHTHPVDPPTPQWERATADAAQRPATWGLRSDVLEQLAAGDLPAKLEVQSRLCKLYPDMLIAHMPSHHIQLGLQLPPPAAATTVQPVGHQQQLVVVDAEGGQDAAQQPGDQQQLQQQPPLPPPPPQQQRQQLDTVSQQQQEQQQSAPRVDCSWLLANAAVFGDQFSWHVDADPQCFPEPSAWTQQYGLYCNREPGKPLFVSLLVYLDKHWPRENDAETLFLDSPTDTGIFVRPKPYRVVLMDQDVAHRLSTPSASAQRPRFSLVWKLVMMPKTEWAQSQQQQQQQRQQQQQPEGSGSSAEAAAAVSPSIARREWGPPTYFGSAAHVLRMAKQSTAGSGAESGGEQDVAHAGKKRQLV